MSEHDPLCEKAWGYPDFLVSRGIKREDCWMCDLLIQAKRDALAGAVQRVEALPFITADFISLKGVTLLRITDVLKAIKGGSDIDVIEVATDLSMFHGHKGETA